MRVILVLSSINTQGRQAAGTCVVTTVPFHSAWCYNQQPILQDGGHWTMSTTPPFF